MSAIHVLESTVFNRIAAGEVVENPRSVVKELLENSIDAGADTIVVEIRGGGIEYICITDNGKGIAREDMPTAFLPHATSKIHTLHDLEAITTLGFRGEALPSIASVADVEMISRTSDSELGYKLVLHGGKTVNEGECGAAFGTKITVRGLFGTIPARAKFLRKPQLEESAITELVTKIILANPHLKIKYFADGKTLYRSDGNGVESAIYTVYGAQFLENMLSVTHTMPDIQLSGVVCKPSFTKPNRTYQTLIVNGRYIVNADISYCIQQCYQEYLMKRQFPAYILYLTIPADMIDVNVHPNKLDVRFANEKRLKGVLYNAIKSVVDVAAIEPMYYSPVQNISYKEEHNEEQAVEREVGATVAQTDTDLRASETRMAEDGIIRTRLNSFVRSMENTTENVAPPLPIWRKADPTITRAVEPIRFFSETKEFRYAGKLFNTYLFVECGENFYIIDQHAAHEKLLYDQLKKQTETGNIATQELLVPYVFEVTPTEQVLLSERLSELKTNGFGIDPLNDCSFSLYAIPVCCVNMNVQQFVSALLHSNETPKAACKSAVKGEEDLTQDEIDSLLRQMAQSNTAYFCPHGRPIMIRCTKSDLEKAFKRIV